jgi:hypothetical protein
MLTYTRLPEGWCAGGVLYVYVLDMMSGYPAKEQGTRRVQFDSLDFICKARRRA